LAQDEGASGGLSIDRSFDSFDVRRRENIAAAVAMARKSIAVETKAEVPEEWKRKADGDVLEGVVALPDHKKQRKEWACALRKLLSPPDMLHEDGTIKQVRRARPRGTLPLPPSLSLCLILVLTPPLYTHTRTHARTHTHCCSGLLQAQEGCDTPASSLGGGREEEVD